MILVGLVVSCNGMVIMLFVMVVDGVGSGCIMGLVVLVVVYSVYSMNGCVVVWWCSCGIGLGCCGWYCCIVGSVVVVISG